MSLLFVSRFLQYVYGTNDVTLNCLLIISNFFLSPNGDMRHMAKYIFTFIEFQALVPSEKINSAKKFLDALKAENLKSS